MSSSSRPSPAASARQLADLLDELGPDAPDLLRGVGHRAPRRPPRRPRAPARRAARLRRGGASRAAGSRPLVAPAGGPAAHVDALRRGGRPAARRARRPGRRWPGRAVGGAAQHHRVRHPPRGRAARPARAGRRGCCRAPTRTRCGGAAGLFGRARPPVAGGAGAAAHRRPGAEKRFGAGPDDVDGRAAGAAAVGQRPRATSPGVDGPPAIAARVEPAGGPQPAAVAPGAPGHRPRRGRP